MLSTWVGGTIHGRDCKTKQNVRVRAISVEKVLHGIRTSAASKSTTLFSDTYEAASGKVYEDFLAANFNRVATDSSVGILHGLSRCHIKLPAMPRTSHHLTLKLPFPQRPASVQTGAADGIDCSRHICQRYCLPSYLHFLDGPSRNFSKLCRPVKRHSSPVGVKARSNSEPANDKLTSHLA